MFDLLDWQLGLLSPFVDAARPHEGTPPWQRTLLAPLEMLARTLEAGQPRRAPVEAAVAQDAAGPVAAEVLGETPFFRLVRLRGRSGRRRVLFVPPHSGFAAAVTSPLIAALLRGAEVLVIDWIDARAVPLAAGRFGLAEQVAAIAEIAAAEPDGLDLVGLSQSCPPVLAAAAQRQPPPRSLVFMGGQLAPRRSPAALQQLIATWPRGLLEQQLVRAVPPPAAGAGRAVYPSILQLATLVAADPAAYFQLQRGLLAELAHDAPETYARQHADLHSLLDVPAELFLDMLGWLLDGPGIDAEPVEVAGERFPLDPLLGVPCLTIEAGADELVGPGQTHAFRERLVAPPGFALTLEHASHHALFTGPTLVREVAPAVDRFYASLEA